MVNIEKDLRNFCRSKGVDMSVYDGFINSYLEPYVIEERNMPITSISVYSRLLMDRIVFLNTNVESTMANILTAQLLWLDQQSDKPINMYINSPGGSVIDGLQLIDTMNFINAPISTTSLGMAASMGAVILSCGEKGKRFVLPHSRVMIHQVSSGMSGTFSDMKIEFEQTERCKKDIYNILAKNVGKSYEEIESLCDRNNWFIGQEAVDLGIADKVVETVKKEGE